MAKNKKAVNSIKNIVDSWNPAVINDAIRTGAVGGSSGPTLPAIKNADIGKYVKVNSEKKLEYSEIPIIKKMTYTGAGDGTTIELINAQMILSIQTKDNGSSLRAIPFTLVNSGYFNCIAPTTKTIGSGSFTYSENLLKLFVVYDNDSAFNRNGTEYEIYYI